MNNNKLIIAAAGSGKTTHLIREALKVKDKKVLITTYTQANEAEIKKKFIELNDCIPENIVIQTWFSFLLKHGVRPFQGALFEKRINGLILVSGQSGLKCYTKNKQPIYFGEEKEFENHYFSDQLKIYSDKLTKFALRCNAKTNGDVVERISHIFSYIFIDEVQDLAGYDLELLKLLFSCQSNILLVGDPRQGTYSTNDAPKNKQFKKAGIINFFTDQVGDLQKDETSLIVNYRCIASICDLSNKLYPTMQSTTSGNDTTTSHDGVFFVKKRDVSDYLRQYQPVQLRYDRKTTVDENYHVMNFGDSKGLSFNRIVIYPTDPILKWIKNHNFDLSATSRSKFYVAITRAKYSVGIVVEDNMDIEVDGIIYFKT
jgi:superfamily I DNA/RNA helicase